MKLPLFLLSLCLLPGWGLAAEELSEATVAQHIVKDEGYRMFHFEPANVQPYRLIIRFKGHNTPLEMQTSTRFVVTVQLDKQNALKSVRVDSADGGMTSLGFPANAFGKFSSTMSQSLIVVNDPFLTLNGADGELQILITPRANG